MVDARYKWSTNKPRNAIDETIQNQLQNQLQKVMVLEVEGLLPLVNLCKKLKNQPIVLVKLGT
jgi:hypothetical protein